MICHRFEEQLKKLGSLKALEADAAFGKHLKTCPACQAKRTEYIQLFDALMADQLPMPDDAYWASFPALVQERIEKSKARPRWKLVFGWSLPVAAMLFVVSIAVFMPKKQVNVANLTAEEAFNYAGASDSVPDIPLPENTLTSVSAQAEDELIGQNNVDELVLSLTDEQFQKLEIKLKSFKL